MKIILSRKGFDSGNGIIPSPIMPDGTLLSLPIPSDDMLSFDELRYGEHTYRDILLQLSPKWESYVEGCHLDPDIRDNVRINAVPNWKPAFGQICSSQSYLHNNSVGKGDLFLFLGRFKQTIGDIAENTLKFKKGPPIIHIIFGYMEIGEVIHCEEIPDSGYTWHPHGFGERLGIKTNTLYIPTEKLSFDTTRPGYGTFNYSEKLVLTLSDKTATWKEIPALMPDNIAANRKNSAKNEGIFYKGPWQELVLKENEKSTKWAKSFFEPE